MKNSMHDAHQRAAEFHNLAAHAHRTAAVQHGHADHLTGHEHSRQALEHSQTAHEHPLGIHQNIGTGAVVNVPPQQAREEDIPGLAYKLWQARGCPEGSSQQDWFRAVEELQSHR
jgi:hypothetical protein